MNDHADTLTSLTRKGNVKQKEQSMNMEATNVTNTILLATERRQRGFIVISELTTCVGEVISPLVSSCNRAVFTLLGYNAQNRPGITCFAANNDQLVV
jgi:hypothetical protein